MNRPDVRPGHGEVLEGVDHFLIRSAAADREFRVLVGHCPINDGNDPVAVYLVDAAMMFGTAVEFVRLLQLTGRLPSVLVIGVGYPVDGIVATMTLRQRDLLDTHEETKMQHSQARGLPTFCPHSS